jgi:hypothetical protein
MRTDRRLVVGITALAGLFTPTPAFADKPAPARSYTQTVLGRKYVFAMVAPQSVEEECRPWNEQVGAELREI